MKYLNVNEVDSLYQRNLKPPSEMIGGEEIRAFFCFLYVTNYAGAVN